MSFRSVYRATGYIQHAEEFISAYFKLSQVDAATGLDGLHKDLQEPNVKLLLLGHALELVLKGWLVLKEDCPTELTREQRQALKVAHQPVPQSLKDLGHDLERLSHAVLGYYPSLQSWIDDGWIGHFNRSYFGHGVRDYEYPEGNQFASLPSPLDELAVFVRQLYYDLVDAIESDPLSISHP